MIELIIPDDIEGDKRIKATRGKASRIARKMEKTHDIVIGTKKGKAKDIRKAAKGTKVKLIKKQAGG